jgi:phage replication O-like protein O
MVGGYTQIPNNILEALITRRFTSRQYAIILEVLRLTLGCHIPRAKLDPKDFIYTGIYRSDVKKEIKKLASLKILIWEISDGLIRLNYEILDWGIHECNNMHHEKRSKLLQKMLANQLHRRSNLLKQNSDNVSDNAFVSRGKDILKKSK